MYLTVKFWSKKNFLADARDIREHLASAGNGTQIRTVGSSKKYKEVNEFNEVVSALINFAAANRELWPFDQVGKNRKTGQHRAWLNGSVCFTVIDGRPHVSYFALLQHVGGHHQQEPAFGHRQALVQPGDVPQLL